MENHTVFIENREKITVTDITDIDSFDEEEVRARPKTGSIVIKGSRLHLQLLDLAQGKAVVSGLVSSLIYVKVKDKDGKSLLSRLMK